MDLFIERYGKKVESPIVIHTKDLRVEDGVTYLPIYMASLIPEMIVNAD